MPQVGNNVGLELVSIEAITSRVSIRSIKRSGVERLKASMRKFGFLPQHALLVTRKADGTYELEDGNHRLEAATDLDITEVPVHVIGGILSDNDKKRIARESNEVAGTLILTTLVDDAEFIWSERELGKNLIDIADILGWSGSKVKQYSALSGITKEAWEIVKATLDRNERLLSEESDEKVTIVTFSEGLLRCILNLTPEQQIELVGSLVSGEITKGQFKTLASSYRASNDVARYVAENPEVVNKGIPSERIDAEVNERLMLLIAEHEKINEQLWNAMKEKARIAIRRGELYNMMVERLGPEKFQEWISKEADLTEKEILALRENARLYEGSPIEVLSGEAIWNISHWKENSFCYGDLSVEARMRIEARASKIDEELRSVAFVAIEAGKLINEVEDLSNTQQAILFAKSELNLEEKEAKDLKDVAASYKDTDINEIPGHILVCIAEKFMDIGGRDVVPA